MAIRITKCIILSILSITMNPKILINGQKQVPCFFVFGDSLFDNGNNNKIISIAKANYLPYGIDSIYGPTGRFNNGLIIPDFLAQRIGFSSGVPPFADAGGSNATLLRLNYASASAGILDETAFEAGQRIPMNQQLRNHQGTVNQISDLLKNQTAANTLLQKCFYTVCVGNNDYINNYYLTPTTLIKALYTPMRFADKLIQQYSQQLTTLYNLGARKVAVFSVAPLGCIPEALSRYQTNGDACVDYINNAVQIFNNKLVSLIKDLNINLPNAKFTLINTYAFLSTNLTTIGIKFPNEPCCQVTNGVGLCAKNGGVCSNRDEYKYFDNFHPTQIVANYMASRAYISQSQSDAIPVDIRTLIQQ